jgi:hypothetical protein
MREGVTALDSPMEGYRPPGHERTNRENILPTVLVRDEPVLRSPKEGDRPPDPTCGTTSVGGWMEQARMQMPSIVCTLLVVQGLRDGILQHGFIILSCLLRCSWFYHVLVTHSCRLACGHSDTGPTRGSSSGTETEMNSGDTRGSGERCRFRGRLWNWGGHSVPNALARSWCITS